MGDEKKDEKEGISAEASSDAAGASDRSSVRTILGSCKRPLDGHHASNHRGVSWDEANLAEHDKERGTRRLRGSRRRGSPWSRAPTRSPTPSADGRKIDEPPTPWAQSPVSSEEETEAKVKTPKSSTQVSTVADALSARLQQLESKAEDAPSDARQPASPAASIRWADAGSPAKKTSSAAFKAKRAAHYDEFRVLQAMRQRSANGKSSESEESSAK
ncbi:unnamed protein product [Durusdinium trenchii]|uniref:Uncharacterized protein n=1 Tax=Durusdinium trenchii TaxID=1381693 RepID=A0ABP0QDA4_9DINO